MKELVQIINSLDILADKNDELILCKIVKTKGPSYRRPGARMLIENLDQKFGVISGGCLEHEILHQISDVTDKSQARIITYDASQEEEIFLGAGTGCGGIIDILVEPYNSSEQRIRLIRDCFKERKEIAIATVIDSSSPKAVVGDWALYSEKLHFGEALTEDEVTNLIPEFSRAIDNKSSFTTTKKLTNGDPVEFFIEYLAPPVHLSLFGAGNDVIPIVQNALSLGWQVQVIDYRKKLLDPQRFPQIVQLRHIPMEQLGSNIQHESGSTSLIATHNFTADLNILQHILPLKLNYIGLLGSQKRAKKIIAFLEKESPSTAKLFQEKVHYPAGLNISPDTPEEISLSILSEIIAVLNGRSGGHLSEIDQAIHAS